MANLTRQHYNLIADATAAIIKLATDCLSEDVRPRFAALAADNMTAAMTGTNSQFKADRFRDRCLGIRGAR